MADATPTDFELLEAWRTGDEGAGRDLFARYFDSVYRFFRNKVDDAAEDLTQQTFMGLVQGKDRFRGDASFRTYLFMIARKKLYSFLRSNQRRAEPVEFHSTSVADLGLVSPSRAVAERQEQQLLLQALRRLPVEMQVALELFYWEELTVTEIAEVLETPVGTVKSRLQRARARLDQVIAELSESEALLRSTVDNFEMWARQLQDQMKPPGESEAVDAAGGDAEPRDDASGDDEPGKA
jgi:RNA polymerase sigma factor (sigma-70 family)